MYDAMVSSAVHYAVVLLRLLMEFKLTMTELVLSLSHAAHYTATTTTMHHITAAVATISTSSVTAKTGQHINYYDR
jgi:hypothetical protein